MKLSIDLYRNTSPELTCGNRFANNHRSSRNADTCQFQDGPVTFASAHLPRSSGQCD
jgi:hypothetical protein